METKKKFLSYNGLKTFIDTVIGKDNISSIGDGTLKGAITSLNSSVKSLSTKISNVRSEILFDMKSVYQLIPVKSVTSTSVLPNANNAYPHQATSKAPSYTTTLVGGTDTNGNTQYNRCWRSANDFENTDISITFDFEKTTQIDKIAFKVYTEYRSRKAVNENIRLIPLEAIIQGVYSSGTLTSIYSGSLMAARIDDAGAAPLLEFSVNRSIKAIKITFLSSSSNSSRYVAMTDFSAYRFVTN